MTGDLLAPLFASPAAPLCSALDATPDLVSVSLLYQGKLADSPLVFVANHAWTGPRAIVLLSPPTAPGIVARAVRRSAEAAALLGPRLARPVLQAMFEGEVDGRSYAITPYCTALAASRLRWYLQRRRVRPVLFDWLHDVAQATSAPVDGAGLESRYERQLHRIRSFPAATGSLRTHASWALSRLASGAWRPRHVLMHGDLWKGNLLLQPPRGDADRPWSDRLAVIDWAGAMSQGYAFFDLVRAADSLRAGAASLKYEVTRHSVALDCEPCDAIAYLLAALGDLLEKLEEFPIQQFARLAESSFRLLQTALPAIVHAGGKPGPETQLLGGAVPPTQVDWA